MTTRRLVIKQPTSKLLKASMTVLIFSTLSGCLISPYYGQKFSSRSAQIPFTVYTTSKNEPITIECAKAGAHGNAYNGNDSYQLVKTIWPSTQGMLDPSGNVIYAASTKQALPEDCFRYYQYDDGYNYITVARVLQDGSANAIYTFDKAGLACLGEWIGKGPTWYNWLNKGCHKLWLNTGKPIRTLFLKAKA